MASPSRSRAPLALLAVAVAVAVAVAAAVPGAGAAHFTAVQSGLWTDPYTWAPAWELMGVPGAGDSVSIGSRTVTFPCPPPGNATTYRTIQSLFVSGSARLEFTGTHDDPAFAGVTCELWVAQVLYVEPSFVSGQRPTIVLGPNVQFGAQRIVYAWSSEFMALEVLGQPTFAPRASDANYGRLKVPSGVAVYADPSRAALLLSRYIRVVSGDANEPLTVTTGNGEPIECIVTLGVVFDRIGNPFRCRMTGPGVGLVSVYGVSNWEPNFGSVGATIPSVNVLGGVLQLQGQVRVYTPPPPCASNPCANGGTCNPNGAESYWCSCTSAWTGPTCSEPANACWPVNPCLNGGYCMGYGQCMCLTGWAGPTCNVSVTPGCWSSPCANGGTCYGNSGSTYVCACAGTWSGAQCTIPSGSCAHNPCWNGGNCYLNATGGAACHCPPGYSGQWCQYNTNNCEPNPCLGGAQCIDGNNTFTCAAPRAVAFNPARGAHGLALNFPALQIAFDQSRMAAGDGVVAVYRLDTMAIRLLFPADSSLLTLGLNGTNSASATNVATVALPTGIVSRPLTTYAVLIAGDAFGSANGVAFGGVALGAWNFTTGPAVPPEYLMHPTDAVQFALQFALPFDGLAVASGAGAGGAGAGAAAFIAATAAATLPRTRARAAATASLSSRLHTTGVKAVATPTSDVEEAVASGQALDLSAPSAAVATVVAQLVQLAAEALDVPAARVRVAALDRAANGETIVTFEFVPAPAAEQQTEASPTGLMAQLRALVQTQGSAFYTTLNALGGPTFGVTISERPAGQPATGDGAASAGGSGSGSGSGGGLTTTTVVIIALSCAVVALSATAFVLYRRLHAPQSAAPKATTTTAVVPSAAATAVVRLPSDVELQVAPATPKARADATSPAPVTPAVASGIPPSLPQQPLQV